MRTIFYCDFKQKFEALNFQITNQDQLRKQANGGNSILFIDIDGDKSGMASCASTRRFAINSSAPHYKEMVSIAMTAYASAQKSVDLTVSDTCNHFGNAQDLIGIKMGIMPW